MPGKHAGGAAEAARTRSGQSRRKGGEKVGSTARREAGLVLSRKSSLPGIGAHRELLVDGIAVYDGFVPPRDIRRLVECAERRSARGEFLPARVGVDRHARRREDIRGDSTCWIAAPMFAAECVLAREFERLRVELNRESWLGLFDLETHYARYAPGTGYTRHVDQLQARDQRVVSMVLYLNEGWTPDAGGELRLFDGDSAYRDIAPMAGRLVCFLTEAREHEVLPTRRDRLSISGWFRRRARDI